jgi:hypothetical protein
MTEIQNSKQEGEVSRTLNIEIYLGFGICDAAFNSEVQHMSP